MHNAKIYMPFSALAGYEEKLKEAETTKEERKELLDDRLEELNYILNQLKVNDIIRIIYYNKNGYLLKKGLILKIDYNKGYLLLDGKKIFFKDIYDIEVIEVI